jgi:hypothetical protein
MINHKKSMVGQMIRFRIVEIDSNICFVGIKKRRCLRYVVRSLALIPKTKFPDGEQWRLPEIFWQ